jgi:hypothetical protein
VTDATEPPPPHGMTKLSLVAGRAPISLTHRDVARQVLPERDADGIDPLGLRPPEPPEMWVSLMARDGRAPGDASRP